MFYNGWVDKEKKETVINYELEFTRVIISFIPYDY